MTDGERDLGHDSKWICSAGVSKKRGYFGTWTTAGIMRTALSGQV